MKQEVKCALRKMNHELATQKLSNNLEKKDLKKKDL